MSDRVRVLLTGRVSIEGPTGTIVESDLPGNQGRIAFAALVHERRPIHRDRLADIVWDGQLPDTWSRSLNAIVSKLRAQLTRAGLDGKQVLVATGGSYCISLPGHCWVDTEDAIRRIDGAEGAERHGDVATAIQEATVASSILRRPFLSGADGEWIADVRRDLSARLYRCYLVLAWGWNRRGDHQLASSAAERAIELDPYRETAYRLLMEAEIGRGDGVAALHAFDRCERMVRAEFGGSPSRPLIDLADRIRRP